MTSSQAQVKKLQVWVRRTGQSSHDEYFNLIRPNKHCYMLLMFHDEIGHYFVYSRNQTWLLIQDDSRIFENFLCSETPLALPRWPPLKIYEKYCFRFEQYQTGSKLTHIKYEHHSFRNKRYIDDFASGAFVLNHPVWVSKLKFHHFCLWNSDFWPV